MANIDRTLTKTIEKWLFKGKVISIYGARQVGKTTLVKNLLGKHNCKHHYYDCELINIQQLLARMDIAEIKQVFLNAKIVALDEAQNIPNIGKILKIIHDHLPEIQIIATGSSSFDLAGKTKEALTGRGLEFILYPLSIHEIGKDLNLLEIKSSLQNILVFGSYPEVFFSAPQDKQILLDNLAGKYLFKDILAFANLKKSDLIIKLLQMLALQLGNEVSTNELSKKLSVTRTTIVNYLELLEKTFVIFRLRPFSRNLRKELTKKDKWYFYDLGIRNSLLSRYQPLDLRDDIGALWENFCIVERLKYKQLHGGTHNLYFWRTHDKKEIDYIEESAGKINGFEFKWNPNAKYKKPEEFLTCYKNSSVKIINRDNFLEFLYPS